MKYEVLHRNTFSYETSVHQSLNTIRLKPRSDERQRLLFYDIKINPASLTSAYVDIWGNNVESFFIPEKHNILEVEATSVVSIQKTPFIHIIDYSPQMQQIFHSQLFREHYLPFLNRASYTYLLEEQIYGVLKEIGDIENPIQFSIELMKYINEVFTYDTEATTVDTTGSEALALKRGVCQDYTHVMLGLLRAKNIPARYISGYLYVGENSNLIGDVATHAWVEIMAPGIGWIGLDPTNNVEALENHIRLSAGRDYTDVSPLQGVYHGGKHTLDVKVKVKKLEHY